MIKVNAIVLAAIALASCGSGSSGGGANDVAATDPIGTNPQGCARFFVGGKAPLIRDPKARVKTRVLCRRTFAVYHSGMARQPLWVAEALTREQIKLGFSLPRVDSFHADSDLPKSERAELKDYSRSGFDRGHMAPDGDMPTRIAANEAFALSNMSPQTKELNRNSWKDLEEAIRRQTRGGTVYVVTGPIFQGARIATTHADGRLLVPTSYFKAVYASERGATIFTATNTTRPQWSTMTVDQFKQVHGIDPFPGIDPKFRNVNGALDGSMNRLSGTAEANGAAANAANGGTGTAGGPPKATCKRQGGNTVQNPTNGQAITPEQYRLYFGQDPKQWEYCQ